jgi:putative oxidoreductase
MTELAINRPATTSFDSTAAARYAVPVGRGLFALLFIMSGISHFSGQTVAYAEASGVPLASVAVPLSGILAIAGAASILVGYRARLGALALVAFLIPVTLMMHPFWAAPDAMSAMMQQTQFLKNAALAGAALLIAYFGAGPISLDARRAS